MENKIIHRPSIKLIGQAISVTLDEVITEKKPQLLASEFKGRISKITTNINKLEVLGVSTDPENYNQETDKFEYFIGVEVSSFNDVPEGMVTKTLPENDYIVFTHRGLAENIGKVHDYLYTIWLEKNEYVLNDRYNIEVYGDLHKGADSEESEIEIYFPIKK
ncbi:MAG: GyrI-like domain-containing protein [Candidatus Cohnella colombiensis]|uniref:GyrI-like domain-containing protein n=1 Tax=Candidatus Cohnella colombiensis TaxID=3121368 RepID=A0AA95JD86_9BACL|nr:MAG: GyrI-like domain-containing protein [Cohnella sp.]